MTSTNGDQTSEAAKRPSTGWITAATSAPAPPTAANAQPSGNSEWAWESRSGAVSPGAGAAEESGALTSAACPMLPLG
jgi:hypothetical protein